MRGCLTIVLILLCSLLWGNGCGHKDQGIAVECAETYGSPAVKQAPLSLIKQNLDLLAEVSPNVPLNLSEAEARDLERSLSSLEESLKPLEGSLRSFRLEEEIEQQLSPMQRNLSARLLHGLNKALSDGTISSIKVGRNKNLLITDETTHQLIHLGKPPAPRNAATIDSSHHLGSAKAVIKWRWKWWGVKIRFSHRAAFYLCNHTNWVSNQLPLKPWIKLTAEGVACSLYLLDNDKDGLTLNINWLGTFWINDKAS